MPGEKKNWRPFRTLSGKQDPQQSNVENSRKRVSSVYLSNDTSASGLVVIPEFDDPARTQTTHEEANYAASLLPKQASTSFHPPPPDGGHLYDLAPMDFRHSSCSDGDSPGNSAPNLCWEDDLSKRLGTAYRHICSMPNSAASPRVSLSSDPQMLRKQLGVPQHSVLNYPIHSSPDLPNPYISSPQSMSPMLPPPASPDPSHTTNLNKLGSCMDADVYSIYPFHGSPEPAQGKSAATGPTLTENITSQCHMVGGPWSTHTICTAQPSVSNSSRHSKRRIEKPTVSKSSLPPSGRRISKGILRKPVPDSLLSTNVHKRQISLPQARPPSPFQMNVPLHHTWHDRRTNFNSWPDRHPNVTQFHVTKSRRTSGNTEVLASLAWIGIPPISDRRCHPANPVLVPDRFSMAISVEDDNISDDALVDRLEMVRRAGGPYDVSLSRSSNDARHPSAEEDENVLVYIPWAPPSPPNPDQLATSHDSLLHSPWITRDTESESDDAEIWRAARKALLCIREIIRTEKKYQEALKMLLNAQTATPPPPSMTPYISALVRASETLLKWFLEDPSAWGVSTAFVTSEDELEATLVSWCAVAGTFFTDGNNPQSNGLIERWRNRKSGVTSSPSPTMTKRTSTSLSPRLLPVFPNKTKDRTHEEYGTQQYPQIDQERQKILISPQKSENTKNQTLNSQAPSRKPSVRDLAIQPIQRVMRYVLLYKDLLDSTPPTSPSRLLVERALEAATRIANYCDRAQRNPAFFHVP